MTNRASYHLFDMEGAGLEKYFHPAAMPVRYYYYYFSGMTRDGEVAAARSFEEVAVVGTPSGDFDFRVALIYGA